MPGRPRPGFLNALRQNGLIRRVDGESSASPVRVCLDFNVIAGKTCTGAMA